MSTLKFVGGLLLGAALGTAAGVLIAPEKGERTRRKIKKEVEKKKRDIEKNINSQFDDLKKDINESLVEKVKNKMNKK